MRAADNMGQVSTAMVIGGLINSVGRQFGTKSARQYQVTYRPSEEALVHRKL